jgi:hypothetical protein
MQHKPIRKNFKENLEQIPKEGSQETVKKPSNKTSNPTF